MLWFLLFLCLVALNIPIAFSMGLTAILNLQLSKAHIPFVIFAQKLFGGCDSFSLLAVPMFILAGSLMETGGISSKLVNLANAMVGHFRNGLGMVSVVSEIFFSGISGASAADTAAIGSVMIPAMKGAGYSAGRAAAIVCAACSVGILVPPCIAMIIYGGVANVSVGALFAGGFIPAFIMAVALMLQLYIQARIEGIPSGKFVGVRVLFKAFKESLLALLIPVIIFGGILGGICTPTEAAVLAVAYGLVVSMFVYREVNLSRLYRILVTTGVVTGQVMILVGMASIFGWVITREQVPQTLSALIQSIGGGKILFLLMVNIVFLFLGCILEGIAIIIMVVPIILPVAVSLGINPIHFGIIMIANIGIGLFTPPVGLGLFIACSIGKVTVSEVIKPLIPYLAVNFLAILLISYWPWAVMVLPNLLFK